jgi:hypothetical protein
MSLQNLVKLSQIKKCFLPDYAHDNKMSKKLEKNDNVIQVMIFTTVSQWSIFHCQNLLLAAVH